MLNYFKLFCIFLLLMNVIMYVFKEHKSISFIRQFHGFIYFLF